MKKIIFLLFIICTMGTYAQVVQIDSIRFVKPEFENEEIDPSIFDGLEPFQDENDAVVYIYRLKSFVGSAVKWQVRVDDQPTAILKQREYAVYHFDGTKKSHYFYFPDMRYNYTHFKPNTYYYVMLKGFKMRTGYFNKQALKELNECSLSEAVKN